MAKPRILFLGASLTILFLILGSCPLPAPAGGSAHYGFLNDLWKFDGTNWTWVSGANTTDQLGTCGVKGTPASTNVPGARDRSVSWIDPSGNFWLFGGQGHDSVDYNISLSDLWKFDGTNWTWVSGANTGNQAGTYGTKGTAAAGNVPGARISATSWIDTAGNLWLFGGFGCDSTGAKRDLNDLWKFDGTNWTWVSGADDEGQPGSYGTKGLPASGNVPGGRERSIGWIDTSGNLWLFGGVGVDQTGVIGWLNDLWKFDGTNWTWISGANTRNQLGTYGAKGTPAAGNVPGARDTGVGWTDSNNNLWLFGGFIYHTPSVRSFMNDLWKFDGNNWTWVSGANTINQLGTYGTKGTPAAGNVPGARYSCIKWMETSGNAYLFGGIGYGSAGGETFLNDLWKYDGANWTWVSGSDTYQAGIYGTKGTPSSGNIPGARIESISWMDASGNLWLFGGWN